MNEDSTPTAPTPSGEAVVAAELFSLPVFIQRRSDGVYVEPSRIVEEHEFSHFIDRLFASGFRFSGLSYPVLERLANIWAGYPDAPAERLADAIVQFDRARWPLYRGVKISPKSDYAEYLFEPVFLETVERTPVLGEINEDGMAQVVSWDERTLSSPTELNIDEFIVYLWSTGVRFGIDVNRVREVIANKEFGRFLIARMLPPEEGRDAGLLEVFEKLHRDNSPKLLASGRVDLRQFANRFPQISAGVVIFKKIPRDIGKPGYTIAGNQVEPTRKASDFDLSNLSGSGTKVERRGDDEYIVATIDGFLDLDSKTNLVSVTEKIINTDGISLRTTGDLSLSGDDFESHGDVQERRVVEGKHMSFHGDVYGAILSRGGNVQINGNIVKGKVSSPGGSITVTGRASQAVLNAVDGRIELDLAEGCTLVAKEVRVARAYNCEIIAEQVEGHHLEGCAVAAFSFRIETSCNRRDSESALNVLIPDFSESLAHEAHLADDLVKLQRSLSSLGTNIGQLQDQPELAKYLAIDMKVKNGEIRLNDQQAEQLNKAAQRLMPIIQKLRQLSGELGKTKEKAGAIEAELAAAHQQRQQSAASINCQIDEISGNTIVRTLPLPAGKTVLSEDQIAVLQTQLRQPGSEHIRLFSGDHDSFNWSYIAAHPEHAG